jgi:hypothetical protein
MAICSINLDKAANNHNEVYNDLVKPMKKDGKSDKVISDFLKKEELYDYYLNRPVGYLSRAIEKASGATYIYDSIEVHRIEERDGSWEVLYTTDKKKTARVMFVDKVYGTTKGRKSKLNVDDLHRLYQEQKANEEYEYSDLYNEVRNGTIEEDAAENERTLGASKRDKKKFKKSKARDKFTEKPNLLHDEQAMLDFAEEVDKAAANKAGERKAYLLDELKQILTGNGMFIPKDLRMFIRNTTQKTGVVFKPFGDKKLAAGIHMTQGSKKGGGTTYQSDLEKLVHDVEHAATYYALNSKDPKVSGIRRRLTKAYNLVMKDISATKLVGKDASKVDKKNAQDIIDHLRSEEGLDEFIALVRTNEMLGDYTKQQTLKYKNENATTIWEMVKNILKDALAVIGGVVGKQIGDQNAYDIVFQLSDELMKINNRTDEEVKRNKMLNAIGRGWDTANRKLADGIEVIATKTVGDTSFIEPLPQDAGKIEAALYTLTGFTRLISDERTRPYMYTALDKISPFLGYDSIFQKVIKSVTSKDDMESTVENLILASRQIDQQMEKVHLNATVGIQKLFDGKLKEAESIMLTENVLELDLQALHNDYDILDLLRSPSRLQEQISKLEAKLADKYNDDYTYYINQSKMLANYMRHGTGNELLNTNALTISRKFGTNDVKRTPSKELVDTIDHLTTMYAMQDIGFTDREAIIDLEEKYPKSIDSLLKVHQGFVQGAKETRFKRDPYNMIKGYVKEINDQEVEIEVAPISQQLEMEQKGYMLVGEVANNNMNLLIEPLAIYKREGFGMNQFIRYAFRTTKNHRKGTTLEEILYDNSDLNKSLVEARQKQVTKLISKEASKKLSHISNRIGVDPKYDNNILPVYDENGKVKTYKAVMSKGLKKDLLNPDKRVGLVMGEMMAGQVNHVESINMNRKVADILIQDTVDNIDKNSKVAGSVYGKNGYEYVEIGPQSTGAELEKWKMLPEDVRYYLQKEWVQRGNKKDTGIPVRKDLLKMYFGQRDFSITDTAMVKMLPHKFQYYVKQAENLWIQIAKIAKVHMIIKTPAVWIGNLFSNIVLLMRDGFGVVDIFDYHVKAIQDLEEYQKLAKEIIALEQKLMTAKARGYNQGVKKLSGMIAAKKGLLRKNAAAPLIDAGQFSSIVEDTNPEEMKVENKWEKKIGKALNRIPNWMQWMVKYSLLTQDTAIYKLFLKITQLGDFLGRYTKYHLSMKNNKTAYREKYGVEPKTNVLKRMELAASNASRDMFVNYNNQENDMLLYLNRLMVVGFTRFFFGTQRVNVQLIKDKPLNAVTDMFLQSQFLDYEDISEHTFLTKNYSALFYSPLDVVDQAFSLMGVNLLTGNAVNGFDGLIKVKAI